MSHTINFPHYLHLARQHWVRTLEPFQRILDIGGSSPNFQHGALIELGYRFRPRELVIFDLPEDQQYWGKPKFPQDRDYLFDWGRIRHIHGRAEHIRECEILATERFDCIFMGETIEHIEYDGIGSVLDWIRCHLAPQGRLIFDTPNRSLTRLQFPVHYIDDDHKYEYTPAEAEALLLRHGLPVVQRTGLLHMPKSSRMRSFEPLEAAQSALLCGMPEESYLFAFECVKG